MPQERFLATPEGGQALAGASQFAGEEMGAWGETAQYLGQPMPGVENIYAGLGAETMPDIAYLQQQQEALRAMPDPSRGDVALQYLGGVAKGAAAGAVLGPPGMAIGALVGGVGAGIRGLLGQKKARADIGEMGEELEQARAGFGAQMRRYNERQTRQEMEGIQQMYNQMLRQNIYAR